jgi:hypothetical protein
LERRESWENFFLGSSHDKNRFDYSMSDLRKYQNELLPYTHIGASVHSVLGAEEAQ